MTQSDGSKKADILNCQFSSVFNKDEQCDSIPNKGPSPFNDMPAIKIGLEGIYKILNRLQIHKATGPDKISCRILKEMAAEVAPILHLFFQASINQGILPTDWKTANVVPIFKKGDKSKAENYRPVSLTSVVCKRWNTSSAAALWNILTDIKSYTMLNMAFGSDALVKVSLSLPSRI